MSGSPFSFSDLEAIVRREWWLNHGHDFHALYGDDGEMQCATCLADFKRDPLNRLEEIVIAGRAEAGIKAWKGIDALKKIAREAHQLAEDGLMPKGTALRIRDRALNALEAHGDAATAILRGES